VITNDVDIGISGNFGAMNNKPISRSSHLRGTTRSYANKTTIQHKESNQLQIDDKKKLIFNYNMIDLIYLSLYEISQIIVREREYLNNGSNNYYNNMNEFLQRTGSNSINSKFDNNTISNRYRSLNLNSIQSVGAYGYNQLIGSSPVTLVNNALMTSPPNVNYRVKPNVRPNNNT